MVATEGCACEASTNNSHQLTRSALLLRWINNLVRRCDKKMNTRRRFCKHLTECLFNKRGAKYN